MNKIFIFLTLISLACSSQDIIDSIVLVNVGTASRERVAELLSSINQHEPKVIAIDLQFSSEKNSRVDNKLIDALNKCNNLVMVSVIEHYSIQTLSHDKFMLGCLPKFTTNAKTGFANLIIEEDQFSSIKKFSLWEYVSDSKELSFALQVAYNFDSIRAASYELNHNQFNELDFKGAFNKFKRFSLEDVIGRKVDGAAIRGKIVLIGFLGPGDDDRFYAPLLNINDGQGKPNIYGLEFHAQVLAQIMQ